MYDNRCTTEKSVESLFTFVSFQILTFKLLNVFNVTAGPLTHQYKAESSCLFLTFEVSTSPLNIVTCICYLITTSLTNAFWFNLDTVALVPMLFL